ncbi:MAG TPA: substrate-binding domain-containing protein, partial [Actinomycetota bacterium]
MGQFDAIYRNPASRRQFLQAMGVAGGAGVLAACRKSTSTSEPGGGTGGGSSTSAARPPIEEETGELLVHEWAGYEAKWIWRDYAEKGYPDPQFSFLTNTEGVIAKTQGGFEWDITHPEVGYIQDYVNMDVLEPWDTSLISNFADLNPVLEATGQIDGVQYEIVTDWGYSCPLIRTDRLDPSINSYSHLFSDEAAGHIGWFDTPWILQMAAMTLGVPADEAFHMDDATLDEAKNFAISKAGGVYTIWVDFTQMWDDVRNDLLWATYAWPDAFVVLKEEVPVAYLLPDEGALSWAEGLVLRKGTENYFHAHEFADAWASVATGQRLISSWGYGHSNLGVDLEKIDPEVVEVFGLDDPETNLSEPQSYIDRYQP